MALARSVLLHRHRFRLFRFAVFPAYAVTLNRGQLDVVKNNGATASDKITAHNRPGVQTARFMLLVRDVFEVDFGVTECIGILETVFLVCGLCMTANLCNGSLDEDAVEQICSELGLVSNPC